MEEHAYLSNLLATIIYLIVGIRLLALCSRTGELAERLLGAYFIFTCLSFVFFLAYERVDLGFWSQPFGLASRVVYDIGVVFFLYFIRQTFRPDETWAGWLVSGCTAAIFFGLSLSIYVGDWYGNISDPWYLLEWSGYCLPCAWLCAESFHSYASASRRARIGLCDRLVVHRYLLWAAFGGFQTIGCISWIVMDLDYEVHQAFSTWAAVLLGVLEVAAVISLSLIFFPPAAYQRWIANPNSASDAAADG
jgi:hypothetical protein